MQIPKWVVTFYNCDMDLQEEVFELDISGYGTSVQLPTKSMIEHTIDQEIFNNWSVHKVQE